MAPIPVRYPDPAALRERERHGYDRTAAGMNAASRERLADVRAMLLERADVAPGQHVLDLCCGTGWLAIDAARAVAPGGRVTGVDLSAAMLELAEQNLREAGLDNVEFHQGDAEQLTLVDASVDRALCSNGLMHVPDPARALAEIARVLVPGGRLVANVPGPEGLFGLLSAALDDAGEPLSLDYRYVTRLSDATLLEGLARDAGFAAAVATLVPREMQIADPGAWWDAYRESAGLFAGLVAELSPAGVARARAYFIERCAPYRSGDGFAVAQSLFYLVAER